MKITSKISIPYDILTIRKGCLYDGNSTEFKIRLCEIPDDQTKESLKLGGVIVKFDAVLKSPDINADIILDVTVGNMYSFYTSLKEVQKNLSGTATLKNYGESGRCRLDISFNSKGQGNISGYINGVSLNGININLDIDQSYCYEWLDNFEIMFKELAWIQGYDEFLY